MASTHHFRYPPLDAAEGGVFRLLTILPGEEATPIHGSLEIACWDKEHSSNERSSTAYGALSYAWGDEEAKLQIILNECPFHVTPTLEQALRRLRSVSQPRKIWIDAIYIDQANSEEKAIQIRQMQHIFTNAD
ncbi:hypothetical protein G7Y89_g8924 [Cudoniella acicularis]|uniref:Heterokaryon incompatibility domain-containing protein n=1 Tax=Cudoniella acicularis TaxID=354080 RepID=A0A8H4RHU4_9HELO|nr:hypothetical protein G7Y89_g8924 [Cudoniella acicularis]